MSLKLAARAKINWSLAITGERADGYHELEMLMQRIDLADELIFERAQVLSLSIDGQRLPTDGRNLVLKAAEALCEVTGKRLGARIRLKKRIPSRAGLGGGSADCAAALLGLNELWNLKLSLPLLQKIGLKLGADVPFCLMGGFALAQGVGEILTPLPDPPRAALALATPGGGLSTPAVFKVWNAGGFAPCPIDSAALADALSAGDFAQAQRLSRNDLEAPAMALMPEIAQCMAAFKAAGAHFVRMSGSGSTVFAVFDGDAAAQAAAARVPGAIIAHTLAE